MITYVKKAFDLMLVEAIQNKNKELTKKLTTALKEDKSFAKAYMLIHNLEQGVESKTYDVDSFIQENRKVAKGLNLESIKQFKLNINKKDMSKQFPILEHINVVLFKEVTPYNLSTVTESIEVVKNHLTEIKERGTKLDIEVLEEKYSLLPKEDQQFILECYKSSPEQIEEMFSGKQKAIISKLKTILEQTENTEDKLLIFETKEKVQDLKFDSNNFAQTLIEMYSLEKEIISDEDTNV